MKALRKRIIWTLLTLFLLPVLMFGIWYGRQGRQKQLDHALIASIKANNTWTVITLLNEGANANATDKPYPSKTLWSVLKELWNCSKANPSEEETQQYPSALLIAASWYMVEDHFVVSIDNPVLVKALLEHGANPNVHNEAGVTPLMIACEDHRLETVRLLLQHGADPNAKSLRGRTPLIDACYQQNEKLLPCLHLLIEHGAEVNATNDLNRTALMNYVFHSDPFSSAEPVRYLLQQGAKVSLKDQTGKMALDYAISRKATASNPFREAALKKEQAEQHIARTGIK